MSKDRTEKKPVTVSVIMPVNNAENWIRNSIESVLNQTFRDFEFIIINDCSNDGSREIIGGYNDSRIRFINNESNLGVARTLNKAISLARGHYFVRMDADDICNKHRLDKQVAVMNNRPDIDVCGSWVWRLSEGKKFLLRYPVSPEGVESFLLFGNPLAHPSVIMRRKGLEDNRLLYDPECSAAQDFELWSRCFKVCSLDNIPEPLLQWRVNPGGVTCSRFSQSNEVSLTILTQMLRRLGITPTQEQLLFHRDVGNGSGVGTVEELFEIDKWLKYLQKKNGEENVFSSKGFLRAAAFSWFRVCLNSSGIGVRAMKCYLGSPWRKWYRPGRDELLYFITNALLKFNRLPTGRIR